VRPGSKQRHVLASPHCVTAQSAFGSVRLIDNPQFTVSRGDAVPNRSSLWDLDYNLRRKGPFQRFTDHHSISPSAQGQHTQCRHAYTTKLHGTSNDVKPPFELRTRNLFWKERQIKPDRKVFADVDFCKRCFPKSLPKSCPQGR
jgi:hypothetical protein